MQHNQPTKNFEIHDKEKTTSEITKGILGTNEHIEEYTINHDQYTILYTTMLISIVVLLLVIAGM